MDTKKTLTEAKETNTNQRQLLFTAFDEDKQEIDEVKHVDLFANQFMNEND